MPVELEYLGTVALLTIDQPETRNALTGSTAVEIAGLLRSVAEDSNIGALVVRGGRGTFCSGGDRQLIERARVDSSAPGVADQFGAIYQVFDLLTEMPIPTIAAIRGAAVGAGVNLALAADVRVVADNARFIAGFLRIGVHPGGGHLLMSHRVAGRQATVAMSLLREEATGSQLKELGIAWASVPDQEVEPVAIALAHRADDPELVRRAMATYREETSSPGISVAEASRLEQIAQFWSFGRPPTRR